MSQQHQPEKPGSTNFEQSSVTDSKKNLLIITSTFPRWKNDTDPPFVFELAKRLTSTFNITVLAPNFPGSLSYETMEGMDVHRFRYFLKNYEKLAGSEGILPTLKKNRLFYLLVPFFILAELIALLKLIRKTKPDIIHAHWILPQGFVAALAHNLTGVPFVATTHGGDIYGLQGKFASALKGYALRNASIVTVVSKDIQNTIKQKYGENVHTEVVPMGVDSTLFHPDKSDPHIREQFGIKGPFLLYVGRLTEKKGLQYLLEAMPAVIKQYPDAKLLVVGTGEQKQNLLQLTQKLNIGDNVPFVGALANSELPFYFASADVFIGPSVRAEGGDTEGFGLTFVEAGMSGCIVVASDVGGISDIIELGKTGFLVKEKDPGELAATIIMILEKGAELNHMKEAARRTLCIKFDWSAIAEKYQKILSL
jgi:glycosyltransferase involved in cell wall biosynthesis